MTVFFRSLITPLLLVVVLVACEKQQAPSPQSLPIAVTVVTLKAEPVILSRQLPGRTNPYVVAEVRPQVTGIVKERLFTEGSLVKAGQALYQLDDATYRASYNSAKALLARAQASVEIAQFNSDRAEDLIKTNAVSKQELLNSLAEKRQAEADAGVAQAQVASAQVKLSYARITSPIDGRIGASPPPPLRPTIWTPTTAKHSPSPISSMATRSISTSPTAGTNEPGSGYWVSTPLKPIASNPRRCSSARKRPNSRENWPWANRSWFTSMRRIPQGASSAGS